jgi:hypothetical protein
VCDVTADQARRLTDRSLLLIEKMREGIFGFIEFQRRGDMIVVSLEGDFTAEEIGKICELLTQLHEAEGLAGE